MSALVTVPAGVITAVLLYPLISMRAGAPFLLFVAQCPVPILCGLVCWWQVSYWIVRRLAEVLLLRAAGAKLRVGEIHRA